MLVAAACVLSTGVWVFVGIYKLTHRDRIIGVIRAHNIPAPHFAYWFSIVIELGGAALILLHQAIWVAILGWLAFLAVATPIFHGAVFRNGEIDYQQLVHVGKNLSIAGGLIALLIVDGTVPRYFGWGNNGSPSAVGHENCPQASHAHFILECRRWANQTN